MTYFKINKPVLELRVALTSRNYEKLIQFYCDALGLEPAQVWNNGQAKGMAIEMGSGTLELFDENQAAIIDDIEAGKRISGQIRFALQVPDLKVATERLLSHGAEMVHPPVLTPWGDFNVRFKDYEGMQITLFQKSSES